MAFVLQDDQKFTLSLVGQDDASNAVPVAATDFAAPPVWAASDDSVLTVTAADDGLSADVEATGKLSTGEVVTVAGTFTNPPAGTNADFSFDFSVDIATSAETSIAFSASTPVHK